MNEATTEREELQEAIEELYGVFVCYPLKKMYGCDHCVLPEDYERLRAKPLRELTWDEIEKFAHKAMTTWGDVEDFKHFLPRLFELLAYENQWPVSVDRLFSSKLQDADWRSW